MHCEGALLCLGTSVGNVGVDTADRALLGLWNKRRLHPSLELVVREMENLYLEYLQ